MSTKSKKFIGFAVISFIIGSSIFLGEAALGLASVKSAFESKDYEAISNKIDIEKITENYKARVESVGSKTGIPFAGMLASTAVSPVLKAITSPKVLEAMLSNSNSENNNVDSKLEVKSVKFSKILDRQVQISLGTKGSEEGLIKVTLDRAGLADWKISDIELENVN